ncbi:hypothetical protein BKA93DRAFT_825232 [Sparassis latifolia]
MRPCIITILPFALAVSIAAVPLTMSTPVTITGIMTATMGLIGPSEVPNPGPMKPLVPFPRRSDSLQRRQIRIANHDIGPNVTQQNPVSALEDPSLLSKREPLEMVDHPATVEKQVADSAPDADSASGVLGRRQIRVSNQDIGPNVTQQNPVSALKDPSLLSKRSLTGMVTPEEAARRGPESGDSAPSSGSAPQNPGISSGTKAVSSSLQTLGAARTNSSAVSHSVLGEVFGSDAEGTSSPNVLHNAVTNLRRDGKPAHPRVGLVVVHNQPGKRHTFVLDTDALLPPPPDPTSSLSVQPTPIQAYQNVGLIDIDSNRPPPVIPDVSALPKNFTMVNGTSNLAHADTQTPVKNVTNVAHA